MDAMPSADAAPTRSQRSWFLGANGIRLVLRRISGPGRLPSVKQARQRSSAFPTISTILLRKSIRFSR
jgi:hypothetical protein